MSRSALSEHQPDAKAVQRAQYEAFEFSFEAPGCVRVTNGSYDDESGAANSHGNRPTIQNAMTQPSRRATGGARR